MEYQDIFAEYFTQYRGQAVAIPVFGDREFTVGIYRCNNAIRKWDRTDGMLWRELSARATDQTTGDWATINRTILSGTLSYPAPTNMRKPPAEVWTYIGGQYSRLKVVDPSEISGLQELSSAVTFIGGANTGYTMYISQQTSEDCNGRSIDYLYYRKPTFLSTAVDPSATVIDMSDPNYCIQDMLAIAFAASKNGFGYKVAAKEKSIAIINMKIENSSGVPGNSHGLALDTGWGVNTPTNDIRL
jgi:hypothetical protein